MILIDSEAKHLQLKPDSYQPLVSIVINNYNYGNFLPKAINSALKQTYKNCEVIVVDDGSTDNSTRIIEPYYDVITLIKKENGGQASAFNAGFKQCRGTIICFLDADDIFQADKVEKVVSYLCEYPDAGWCFHPMKIIDVKSEEIDSETIDNSKSNIYDIRPEIKRGKLRNKTPFKSVVTSGMCFRRGLLDKLLPMPEEIRITSDDYLKYASFGIEKGIFLCDKLAIQVLHGNNAYTRQEDHNLISRISILTAYWLNYNHPILRKFSNKIFAFGLGTYLEIPRNKRIQEIINTYTSSLKLPEIFSFYGRVFFFRANRISIILFHYFKRQ